MSPRLLILSGDLEELYCIDVSSAESNSFRLDASALGLPLEEGAVGNLKSEENDAEAVLVTTGELGTLACDIMAELRLLASGSSDCSTACVDEEEGLSIVKNFELRESGEAWNN